MAHYNYNTQKWEDTGSSAHKTGTVTPSVTPSVTDFSPAYGGKPDVPDPAAILKNVIAANVGMMPDIKGLGQKASNYFWNQTVGRVPGYEDMAAQSAKNIGAQLRGEIPADVLYQLGQGAAERGIATGGGFSNADYLRSLGLTSLGLMGEGERGLTGALQRAESIPLFDISKYMLSPQEAYNAAFQANVIGAAPDPAAAAAATQAALNKGAQTSPGRIGGMPSLGGGGTSALTPGFDWNKWSLSQTTPSTTQTSTWNPWGAGGWTGPGGTTGESGIVGGWSPWGTAQGAGEGTGEGGLSSDYLDQLLFGGAGDYEDAAAYDPLANLGSDYGGYGDWGAGLF